MAGWFGALCKFLETPVRTGPSPPTPLHLSGPDGRRSSVLAACGELVSRVQCFCHWKFYLVNQIESHSPDGFVSLSSSSRTPFTCDSGVPDAGLEKLQSDVMSTSNGDVFISRSAMIHQNHRAQLTIKPHGVVFSHLQLLADFSLNHSCRAMV